VHFGERLLGGVSIVGISNFVTFLENTEAYRRDLRRAEYGHERDPDVHAFLERISPLNNAGRIRTPLFVAQGPLMSHNGWFCKPTPGRSGYELWSGACTSHSEFC
jgi:hypothetical protein